jgi:hypothetical protein
MSGPVRGDSAVIQHLITLPFPSAATGLTYFCESSRVRRHTEIHTHTHTHTHTHSVAGNIALPQTHNTAGDPSMPGMEFFQYILDKRGKELPLAKLNLGSLCSIL